MDTNTKIRTPKVFKVAGVSFHKKNVESLSHGNILHLELDPENKYDSNAVKVLNDKNEMLGFVPKEFNSAVVKKFEKISKKYTLIVKNIHIWDGPTGLEVEFISKDS